jgi:putative iron-regulated protein
MNDNRMSEEPHFGVLSAKGGRVGAYHSGAWLAVFVVLLNQSTATAGSRQDGNADEAKNLQAFKHAVVANYTKVVSATYQDAVAGAERMGVAIEALLAAPSEESLAAARRAWLAARVPYSQTEAFRFYDGPIDQVESAVNSWPIDENYLDYTAGNPKAGLINDPRRFPVLSKEVLLSLNEKEGKKNISTGFHAIEFLLWGQDTSTNGPGNRPWRDFADGTENAARRRQCLRVITELLIEKLKAVAANWEDGQVANFRSKFVNGNADAALGMILKGIGALSGSELAGERLTSPYETKEQEEEQDCFSDNTRNDLIDDAIGIQNVVLGRYRPVNGKEIAGPGVGDLVKRLDPALGDRLIAKAQDAVERARAIPQPFDQAILGNNASPGRVAVKGAIKEFQSLSDTIAASAKVLSIKLDLHSP